MTLKMHPLLRDRVTEDSTDKWTGTLSVHFAIADCLTALREYIPIWWEYAPGAVKTNALTLNDLINEDDYPTCCIAQELVSGELTADDLRHAGNVLHRYTNVLRTAGEDY
jgi:hypothetical protein